LQTAHERSGGKIAELGQKAVSLKIFIKKPCFGVAVIPATFSGCEESAGDEAC
jgi:hypothetical protein